jgi:sulfatase maturation enzyme AslB (radical SAM superfamily)
MYNIKKILNFYFGIILKNYKKLNLSVTNECNMKCKICNIWKTYFNKPQQSRKELSLSDFDTFFKKFNYWNWISFTGGEPFLRKDLADIVIDVIENCKKLYIISIPTNGYLTDKIVKDVKKILKTNIPSFYISISLDGPKQFHDKNRGLRNSFNHAVKTFKKLKRIKDKRLKVHFEYTISKFNQGKLSEFINNSEFSANDFFITIAQKSYFYKNLNIDCIPDKIILNDDIKFFLSEYRINGFHDLGQWVFLQYLLKDKKIPCVANKNTFYMDPYGKIFPCILIQKQVGDTNNGITEFFKKDTECSCYTPCESYFSLMLNYYSLLYSMYLNYFNRPSPQIL